MGGWSFRGRRGARRADDVLLVRDAVVQRGDPDQDKISFGTSSETQVPRRMMMA